MRSGRSQTPAHFVIGLDHRERVELVRRIADDDERRLCDERPRERGDRTRDGGHERDAATTRRVSPRVRRVRGRLRVTHLDDVNAFERRRACGREHRVDPVRFDRARNEHAA